MQPLYRLRKSSKGFDGRGRQEGERDMERAEEISGGGGGFTGAAVEYLSDGLPSTQGNRFCHVVSLLTSLST